MRIASLLPAATEWVCAFGGQDDLVARSHECDAPPSVQSVPAVTQPAYPEKEGSAAINEAVQTTLQDGLSLYDVDLERLRRQRPDLIITQAQCEVCAVSLPQLEEALEGWADSRPTLFSLEPMTLKEVFDAGLRIGRAIGRLQAAMSWLGEAEKRLRLWQSEVGLEQREDPAPYPTVACIEWMDPLMTAGHWMPDVAEQAGGRALLAEKGKPSRRIAWEALQEADPDVLAIMPCGFTLAETLRDLGSLTERPGWNQLRAVQHDRVFVFDGNAFFNRPGPRLYRSIELLAAALRPEEMPEELAPKEQEMIALTDRRVE